MRGFGLSLTVAQVRLAAGALGLALAAALLTGAPPVVGLLLVLALAGLAVAMPSLVTAGSREGLRALEENAASLARDGPGDSRVPPEMRAVDAAIHSLSDGLHTRLRLADANAARYFAFAESLPALVWVIGADGATLYQSARATAYLGDTILSDAEERLSAVHPDDRVEVEERRRTDLAARREFAMEVRLRRQDGAYLWHQITSVPFTLQAEEGPRPASISCAVEIGSRKEALELQARFNAELERRVIDATRRLNEETGVREKAERRLRQTQKMEAISRLTGGIAHDLNNKLMVMNANIDSVAKQLKEQPNLRRKLLSALVASDQAAALLSKLLTFARQRELQVQYIDIGQHLESIGSLLERSFVSDSVSVSFSIPEDLWPVEVDPHELETAIVNLGVNARDAMAEGGSLAIEARNVHVRAGTLSDPAIAGDFVQVEIRDTGVGIPKEALEHVFEPFYTTKGAGRASGLGLSQVHGFVKQLGGTVEIASTPGEGTSVMLYLPRAALPALTGAKDDALDLVEDDDAPSAQAEILVVDDEVEVAFAVQGLLQESGYKVRIAIGSEEAMEALALRRPNLVLTDVTMPGAMDGLSLAREIREAYPGLPVVLITGNPMVVEGASEFPLLAKPIVSRELHAALQRSLAPSEETNVVSLFGTRRS